MSKIRIRYSKTGKAGYISHLDLMSTMHRAFLRAGVLLKYSDGFNPHPYMSVALPLSVGCESLCELMDVDVIHVENLDVLNQYLPEGITILEFYEPSRKFSVIKWLEVSCTILCDDLQPINSLEHLSRHFSSANLFVEKKSKSGTSTVNIAPFIRDVNFAYETTINITAKISAQNPTININDLTNVINSCNEIQKPCQIHMKRIDIYDKDMILFR